EIHHFHFLFFAKSSLCHLYDIGEKQSIPINMGSKREGTKRGRKPGRKSKSDMKAKLERSRQSARECRARKKLRYQYLEELVANREKAVFALHRELDQYRQWAKDIDEGKIPEGLLKLIEEEKIKKSENE
ncbi:hypothetical protein OTU49_005158, partial [Cherax quadricarinatus]